MALQRQPEKRMALTLVEVLIVLAIISLLIQISLPAVEMSRESARRRVCTNNLRQLGHGMQLHVTAYDQYPSGGWGIFWIGDPDRGTGPEQPGSWTYNILPYIEQSSLREKGTGLSGQPRLQQITELLTTPISLFYCPSRRLARAYPKAGPPGTITLDGSQPIIVERVARSDYAVNTGDELHPEMHGFDVPTSYAAAEAPTFSWYDTSGHTGICFGRSRVSPKQVTDGLSKTYMIGEKYIPTQHYKTGIFVGDNESMYSGFNNDSGRSAREGPCLDTARSDVRPAEQMFASAFGSTHPTAWHVVLCDGSVHGVAYDIDPVVHRRLANRGDGEQITISD